MFLDISFESRYLPRYSLVPKVYLSVPTQHDLLDLGSEWISRLVVKADLWSQWIFRQSVKGARWIYDPSGSGIQILVTENRGILFW